MTSPNRILVVEDETFIRMDAVEMLRAAGFEIVEAINADEAIQALERDPNIRLHAALILLVGAQVTAEYERIGQEPIESSRRSLQTPKIS